MLAGNSGHLKCLQLLVTAGASVNIQDEVLLPLTEVFLCLIMTHHFTEDNLVSFYHDGCLFVQMGETALMGCADLKCASVLLAAKAKVNIQDKVLFACFFRVCVLDNGFNRITLYFAPTEISDVWVL